MLNYAFVDGQNLYSGVQSLNWKLDLRKFRIHLGQKYQVAVAYYFIGYVAAQANLYRQLQGFGYDLRFKPVVQGRGHDPKGNVDADLVLKTMIEFPNFDNAIIVAGDGDYYSLVDYLKQQQ
jgi:NYN domain